MAAALELPCELGLSHFVLLSAAAVDPRFPIEPQVFCL